MRPDRSYGTIKVVRIIARLNIGGPAIQAIILTEGLKSPRFCPYLITGSVGPDEGEMTDFALEHGVQPFVISELGREISCTGDFLAFFKLLKVLRTIRPDIVHTHTAKAGTLGRLAAILTGIPIRVHTFHGHVFQGYFNRITTQVFLLIERWLSRMTDRIVVVSHSQQEELTNIYKIAPKKKFQIIPLGFDLKPFLLEPSQSDLRAKLGLLPTAFVIGFAGRLVPIKNPFLIIDALQQLEGNRSVQELSDARPITLMFLGDGQLDASLKGRVQKEGLNSRVLFLGWRRDMAQMYSASDIVVLTSLNEGTPVVLIEAMASGKPFVATDVGGTQDLMVGEGKEIIGSNGGRFTQYDNGILIASQDAEGLTGALLYLKEHPDLSREMGRTGREFVVKKFTKEQLLGNIQDLYEELIRTKKSKFSWI